MCELLGFNSLEPTNITLSLKKLSEHGGGTAPHKDGWGYAFYQGAEAIVVKSADAAVDSETLDFIIHQQFSAELAIAHIRKATQGNLQLANTQPYAREILGHRFVFAHNGDLHGLDSISPSAVYHPIGGTDSEHAFCLLANCIHQNTEFFSWSLLQRMQLIQKFACCWRALGPANFLLSDSEYLYAHADRRKQSTGEISPPGLHCLQRECTEHEHIESFQIVDKKQSVTLVASVPLTKEDWVPLACGDLIAIKDGKIHGRLAANNIDKE